MSPLDKLEESMKEVDDYYRERGIFQGRFGFGEKPAVVVIDFAYGWTDDAYAGGSRRLDGPVQETARILAAARSKSVPIVYTTSPYQDEATRPLKSAADVSQGFRKWDPRACRIDERIQPCPGDKIIEKESASAFFGTPLVGWLTEHRADTLLITGCSTSACVRATATDAKSYRFKPIIIRECVGDRAEAAHIFTLFDIQARFADVVSVEDALNYLAGL